MKRLSIISIILLLVVGVASAGGPIFFGDLGIVGRQTYFPTLAFVNTFTGTNGVRLDAYTPDTTVFNKLYPWTSATGTIFGNAARHTETLGGDLAPANTCTSVTGEADVTTGWTNSGMATFASDSLGTEPVGTHSLHLVANSDGDKALSGALTTVAGAWYQLQVKYITINGGANTSFAVFAGTSAIEDTDIISATLLIDTVWTTLTRYFRSPGTAVHITLYEGGTNNNIEAYVDTVSLKPITLSSILTLSNLGFSEGRYWFTPAAAVGELSGIVILANDSTASTDALFCYVDRTAGKLQVFKRVAGTDTSLISTAITYSVGKKACLVYDKTEGKIWAFYNNAIVGTAQALTDASVINNTWHGIMSTGAATVDDVDFAPIGLGADVVTNGTMEADANWADYAAPTSNTRSSEQAHSGTYSRKIVANSGNGANQIPTVTNGELYYVSNWVFGSAGSSKTSYKTAADSGTYLAMDVLGVVGWRNQTGYIIPIAGLRIVLESQGSPSTFYEDDISVKLVD